MLSKCFKYLYKNKNSYGKNEISTLSEAFNNKDIQCAIKVIRSKYITMSHITKRFEKKFAKNRLQICFND